MKPNLHQWFCTPYVNGSNRNTVQIILTASGLALATDLGEAVLFQHAESDVGSALSHSELPHSFCFVHLKHETIMVPE